MSSVARSTISGRHRLGHLRGDAVTTFESEVLETFLAQLKTTADVPAAVTEQLGVLLAGKKLPKPDQLTTLFAMDSGEPIA